MGDRRFDRILDQIRNAADRQEVIDGLSIEELVAALAATSREKDPYLANVLGSAALNRVRRKAAILEMAAEGMLVADAAGRLVYANRAALRMLGVANTNVRRRPVHALLHGGECVTECRLQRALKSVEQDAVDEDRFVDADGHPVPVAYTTSPILREGVPDGHVMVFRDIGPYLRANRQRETLARVREVIASGVPPKEGMPRIIEAIALGYGWDAGGVWLHDRVTGMLRHSWFWHHPSYPVPTFERASVDAIFSIGQGIPGGVWRTRSPYWATDFSVFNPERFPRVAAAARDGLRGMMAFPAVADGGVLAVVEFFSRSLRAPGPDTMEVMDQIGIDIGRYLDRTTLQSQLSESEARIRGMLDAALDAILTIDADGRIIEYNAAAETILGFRPDEAIGRHIHELIVPERYREAHRRGLARYLASGEGPILGRLLELPSLRKDGSEFMAEMFIVPLRIPGVVLFTSHMRDITARLAAQRALAAGQERLRTAVEVSGIGAWEWDVLEDRFEWSERASEIMGQLPPGSEAFYRAIDADDRDRVRALVEAALDPEQGGEFEAEFQVGSADAARRWVRGRGRTVFEGSGVERRGVRIVGALVDVSDLVRAQVRADFHRAASDIVSRAADPDEAILALTRLVVGGVADWASVHELVAEDVLRMVHVAHVDPRKVAFVRDMAERYPPDPRTPGGLHEVARTGEAQLLLEVTDEFLEAAAVDAEHLGMLKELGLRSSISVPLRAMGATLGILCIASSRPARPLDEEDLRFAVELGSLLAALLMASRSRRQPAADTRAGLHDATAPGPDR